MSILALTVKGSYNTGVALLGVKSWRLIAYLESATLSIKKSFCYNNTVFAFTRLMSLKGRMVEWQKQSLKEEK